MLNFLTDIVEVQAASRSGATEAYSVSYATSEASALGRVVPIRGKELLSILGGIPERETAELYLHPDISIEPGYRVVHNSITYEVLTTEDWGTFKRCLIRRLEST